MPSACFDESGQDDVHMPCPERLTAPVSVRGSNRVMVTPGGVTEIRSYPSVQEIKPEDSGTCSLGQDETGGESPRSFRTGCCRSRSLQASSPSGKTAGCG